MHILITGAGGHLGRKLFDHLDAQERFEVTGLDIRALDHPRIHTADLSAGSGWATYLDGIDTIVHFAADREPAATWASSIQNNMDATLALYHHAVLKGVSRVILASSNWVHADKRFSDDRITRDTCPGPVNAYGMSKLFGERTGAYFAEHHNLSVICLRIGWTQWTHNNQPGLHMDMGRWGQEMWLSDRDFLAGMGAAITVSDVRFAAVHLMSNNPGMRWNVEETELLLGFALQDGAPAKLTLALRLQASLKKLFTFSIPRFFEKHFLHW